MKDIPRAAEIRTPRRDANRSTFRVGTMHHVREGLTVDRDFVIPYYTFVLRGFHDAGLTQNIRFGRINPPGRPATADGTPMLLIRGGQSIFRLFVSTGDQHDVDDRMLEWADVYGKVNLAVDEHRPGIVALGPTFGIRLLARVGRVPAVAAAGSDRAGSTTADPGDAVPVAHATAHRAVRAPGGRRRVRVSQRLAALGR